MYKVIASMFTGLALSACGGGGGSMSNQPLYGLGVIKQSADGQDGLVRIYDGSGEKMVGVGTLADIQTASTTSTSGWTSINEFQDGDYYTFTRSTVLSNGDNLKIDGSGINLNSSGTEYVSMFIGQTDNGAAFMVTGTPAIQLPTGVYSYQGYAVLLDTSVEAVEAGTFGMNVNFDNNTGSITGASANYIFTDSQVVINPSNGEFSGASGTLGPRSGVKVPASLEGSFYGSNATGVGGVVISDMNQDEGYMAVFRSDIQR